MIKIFSRIKFIGNFTDPSGQQGLVHALKIFIRNLLKLPEMHPELIQKSKQIFIQKIKTNFLRSFVTSTLNKKNCKKQQQCRAIKIAKKAYITKFSC